MSTIKRINPRRPYQISPSGLKRIILGDTSAANIPQPQQQAHAKTKPLRPRTETAAWHMAIVHSERGSLDAHAREAIAAAALLAKPSTGVLAVVLGPFSGATRDLGADVVAVLDAQDAGSTPEHETALLARLIATYNPAHIFMADIAATADLGRRLIARCQATSATRVVELDGAKAVSPCEGGASLATLALPRFVLLAPGAVEARLPFTGEAAVLPDAPVAAAGGLLRDLGTQTLSADHVPLDEADFIVSAGNGVRNIATLKSLAKALGAAVGASRVAVDDGKFARAQQIGATGKTVTATTYMAVGISGAVQHLQGIKDCRHVIAVNRDGGAPILGRADFSVIGDAEGVMQALLVLISEAQSNAKEEAA